MPARHRSPPRAAHGTPTGPLQVHSPPGSRDTANATLLGHPTGLFGLFFVEMWERFSFYGMRALLVFYMTKDFLHYPDSTANTVYGAYTSLVYMSPFFGGMLADRLLGQRRAIILGGLLMAAGHFMMTIETTWAFFTALALLIAATASSSRIFRPSSARSIRPAAQSATAASRSSTWASTSGPPSRRCCAASLATSTAGTGDSGWRLRECWRGSRSSSRPRR